MENYEGLTVQVNEKNHEYRLTLSGYATKYCKAMIISDMGLTGLPPKEKKRPQSIGCLSDGEHRRRKK